MTKANAFITVGKIGSPSGVKGWLKIQSYTELGASILEYQPWYISDHNNVRTAITVEDSRIHHNGILAKLPNVNSPEEAKLLTGRLIEVDRSHLPTLDNKTFYWSDLIGLTVIDANGITLGTVTYMMETGSNDVLIIKDSSGKEHGIPYLSGSVIKSVDLEKKQILVDWELI